MSPTPLKIVFISLKVLIISTLLLLGLRAHCKMEQRDYRIISLMVLYLVLLIVITIVELIRESIPVIFIILVITSASQVYQVNLFFLSCRQYMQFRVFRTNRIILAFFFSLYLGLFVLTFVSGIGARCGYDNMSINGRTYPFCFVLLFLFNILFWIFTSIQTCKNYQIDLDILSQLASEQTEKLIETTEPEEKQELVATDNLEIHQQIQQSSQMKSLFESQVDTEGQQKPPKKGLFGIKPRIDTSWIDIFKFQTRQWECFHTVQTIASLVILGLQFNMLQQERAGVSNSDLMLLCKDDGYAWEAQDIKGTIFIIMHTLVMISSAVQVERAFYTVLHKTMYFTGEVPLTQDVVNSIYESSAAQKKEKDQSYQDI